jgi:hypothetical protein
MPGGSTGQLTSTDLLIIAGGFGGNGGISSGGANGNGGNGVGGTSAAQLADGAFNLGGAIIASHGAGGSGAAGGEGSGGITQFSLIDTAAGPIGARTLAGLQLLSDGFGGSGAGGATAASDAGSASLTVQVANPAAALGFTGDLDIEANGDRAAAGDGFTGAISGGPLLVNGNITVSTARDVSLSQTQPLHSTGDLTLDARALTGTGQLAADGNAAIGAVNGIALTSLSSGGTTVLQAPNGSIAISNDLASTGQVTALAQSLDITSQGALSFANAQASAGDLAIATQGDLTLANAGTTGALDLSSAGGSVTASNPISAGGNVSVSGQQGVTLPSLASGGTTLLQASGGAIDVASLTSPGQVTASGGPIDIVSPGALSFAGLTATGALTVQTGGALTSTGSASAPTADIAANGDINFASLTTSGATSLKSASGNVTVGDLLADGNVTATGLAIDISSTGGLSFDQASASGGDHAIHPASDLTAAQASATGGVTLASATGAVHATGDVNGAAIALTAGGDVQADANLTSTGALNVDAGGTFALGGTAIGSAIQVTSADIDLGATAALGQRGTTGQLTLINGAAGSPSFIGGASHSGAYSLDLNEAKQLFADNSITFETAPGSTLAPGDITIGDLQMSYGAAGNIGSGGRVEISTPGNVAVTGAVQLTTATPDDTFAIDPQRIDIVTDTGSIAMLSTGGVIQGDLELAADTVAAMSQATRGQVDAAGSLDRISGFLATPGPAGPAGGYLQAGTIAVSIGSAFYVQNAGASTDNADRRGFTANQLLIDTTSPVTRIAINGVIVSSGPPVTGADTASLVSINGQPATAAGQFDPRSTINGCIIGADCTIPQIEVENPSSRDLLEPATQGDKKGETQGDQAGQKVFTDQLVQLVQTQPLITPPLVDEPITGVGNDDLWQPGCAQGDSSCAPDKGNEQGGDQPNK